MDASLPDLQGPRARLTPTARESVRAYVFVNVRAGKERELTRRIADMPGVRMADACWGVPEIFVVAEVANVDELNRLVIDKIQSLEGVERNETHLAIE